MSDWEHPWHLLGSFTAAAWFSTGVCTALIVVWYCRHRFQIGNRAYQLWIEARALVFLCIIPLIVAFVIAWFENHVLARLKKRASRANPPGPS